MSDQYVGEIRMFAGNYAPVGWAFCDGTVLPINGNEMLYSVIGTVYGGDGQTTFCLPDLRGRIPLHTGQSSVSGTTYAMGQQAGVEKVTLTASQLPQHTHPVQAQSVTGTTNAPANAFWAGSTINQYSGANPDSVMNTAALSVAGGGQAHDNMMPYLPVSFIIALQGYYPTQG